MDSIQIEFFCERISLWPLLFEAITGFPQAILFFHHDEVGAPLAAVGKQADVGISVDTGHQGVERAAR